MNLYVPSLNIKKIYIFLVLMIFLETSPSSPSHLPPMSPHPTNHFSTWCLIIRFFFLHLHKAMVSKAAWVEEL